MSSRANMWFNALLVMCYVYLGKCDHFSVSLIFVSLLICARFFKKNSLELRLIPARISDDYPNSENCKCLTALKAGYSKYLSRFMRRDLNKSHFIPEILLLK